MSTDVPLLNDYKRAFVRNRLLTTFLGGIRLTGCPWYAVLIQLGLLILPVTVIVLVTTLVPYSALGTDQHPFLLHYALLCSFLFSYTVILQIIVYCCHQSELNAVQEIVLSSGEAEDEGKGVRRRRQLFEEEDDAELDGCCSTKTWQFVISRKKFKVNIMVHALMASGVGAAALTFLDLDTVRKLFGGNTVEAYFVIVFGWVSVVNALYGVMIAPPPETATFRFLDTFELGSMSRPLHVILLTLPQLVADHVEINGPFGGIDGYWYGPGPWFWLSKVSHIVLAAAPLFWLTGIFPPLEAFILWSGEQLQMFAFGGSATTSHLRFWTYLFLSFTQFGIIYVLVYEVEMTWVLSLASISGYFLSLDLLGFVKHLFQWPWDIFKGKQMNQGDSLLEATRRSNKNPSLDSVRLKEPTGKPELVKSTGLDKISRALLAFKEIFSHVLFFTLNAVIVLCIPYEAYKYESEDLSSGVNMSGNALLSSNTTASYVPNQPDIFRSRTRHLSTRLLVCGWLSLTFYLFLKISNELQKVYFLFGTVHSPIYSGNYKSLVAVIWHHFRSLTINFILPLFLTFYAKSLILEDMILVVDPLPTWIEIVAIIRAMRWIWQNPESALIELTTLHLLVCLVEPLTDDVRFIRVFFKGVSRAVQLLFVGILRDRWKQIVEKIYFVVALSVSSLEDRASKRSYAGCLFQMNIVFFPVILVMVICSSVVSAPMLAFFTLPVFFVAFPRPLRFWSEAIGIRASTSEDSVYYQQMVSSFMASLQRANRAGRLGILQPGNHMIARHEDRMIWIQVLEKGNNYLYLAAKGMELQETSCHSLEATRLDDMFHDTFLKKSSLNLFAFHTVTPLIQMPVRMYSDARNVLTGIIESPDTLETIGRIYLQSLTWYLVQYLINRNKNRGKSEYSLRDVLSGVSRATTRTDATRPTTSTMVECPDEVDETSPDNRVILLNQSQSPDGSQRGAGGEEETRPTLIKSDSVNNVELDSWPATTAENSPEDERAQWAKTTSKPVESTERNRRSSAYQRKMSSDSTPSILDNMSYIEDDETQDLPSTSLKRNMLLPPLTQRQRLARSDSMDSFDKLDSFADRLDNLFLPGGVSDRTPLPERKMPRDMTMITPAAPSSDAADEVTAEVSHEQKVGPPVTHQRFGSYLAEKFAPEPKWLQMPRDSSTFVDNIIETALTGDFPQYLVKTVVAQHLREQGEPNVEDQIQMLLEDMELMLAYQRVINSCFYVVYGLGSGGDFRYLCKSYYISKFDIQK